MSKQLVTLHNEVCAHALFARVDGGIAQWRAHRRHGGICLDGPHGLFCIVCDGRLYLRVDDLARARHERIGTAAFRPYGGRPLRGYYEVPAAVLGDGRQLRRWMDASAALPPLQRTGH